MTCSNFRYHPKRPLPIFLKWSTILWITFWIIWISSFINIWITACQFHIKKGYVLSTYTTANTIIGPDIIALATKLSVTVKQSIAFENTSTGNLYFTPPIILTYCARRPTIKFPVGLRSFRTTIGVPLKF